MRKQSEFYKSYLGSASWKRKREEAIKRAGYCCEKCKAPSVDTRLEVHHKTYKRLGKEVPEDLIVLCKACHDKADWSRALNEWAMKVYGEEWLEVYDYEFMQEKFGDWIERKHSERLGENA